MPKLNYSLQDIDLLADKGLLTREERMILRQDYYRESTREPGLVESVIDTIATPIRAAQKFLDDQANEFRKRAQAARLEKRRRDAQFAERIRQLTETPSPIEISLEASKQQELRYLEALKAARDLPPDPASKRKLSILGW